MVVFPNAKINLGLYITGRRSNGYHDLLSVMLPVDWCDALEIVPGKSQSSTLTVSGIDLKCDAENNIVMKAYKALNDVVPLPAVDIYLHKAIPHGAGLGGGSADAAFLLTALNKMLQLDLSAEVLSEIIAPVGADCPLFIYNRPMLASGTGTTLSAIDIPQLRGKYLLIIKPPFGISTAVAYRSVEINPSAPSLEEIISLPINQWHGCLTNAFEKSLSSEYPQINLIKEKLYQSGAIYASLSGSGSALYGIYENDKMAETAATAFGDCHTHLCRL